MQSTHAVKSPNDRRLFQAAGGRLACPDDYYGSSERVSNFSISDKRQPVGPVFRQTRSNVPDRRVALLQSVLTDRSVYASAIDGVFGSQTASAVKSFQSTYGIPVDGTDADR